MAWERKDGPGVDSTAMAATEGTTTWIDHFAAADGKRKPAGEEERRFPGSAPAAVF